MDKAAVIFWAFVGFVIYNIFYCYSALEHFSSYGRLDTERSFYLSELLTTICICEIVGYCSPTSRGHTAPRPVTRVEVLYPGRNIVQPKMDEIISKLIKDVENLQNGARATHLAVTKMRSQDIEILTQTSVALTTAFTRETPQFQDHVANIWEALLVHHGVPDYIVNLVTTLLNDQEEEIKRKTRFGTKEQNQLSTLMNYFHDDMKAHLMTQVWDATEGLPARFAPWINYQTVLTELKFFHRFHVQLKQVAYTRIAVQPVVLTDPLPQSVDNLQLMGFSDNEIRLDRSEIDAEVALIIDDITGSELSMLHESKYRKIQIIKR